MKPNIVLLATVSCFYLVVILKQKQLVSAEEARTKAQIALIEQQKEIEKKKIENMRFVKQIMWSG